jgi:FkbM family methyltransferase
MVNKAKAVGKLINSIGWRGTCTWALYKAKKALGREASSLRPAMAKYPVKARLGNSSDIGAFAQIFIHNEYACLRSIEAPRVIFDLGANVGYSSAYFLSCFPSAKVLAVEPDPGNFEMCGTNLAPYGDRVALICGAAWSSRTMLKLSPGTFGDGREWATRVVTGDGDVEGWDIPSLMRMARVSQIDLLKVDIEGGELELFSGNTNWLKSVRNICIELHSADCERVFFDALKGFSYDLDRSGELTICRNIRSSVSSPLECLQ